MSDLLTACASFGLLLPLGTYQLARFINRRAGKELCNPLLFSTICCCALLLLTDTDYDTFCANGGNVLDFFVTPATICLAIPLYKQFDLLKKHAVAVAAGCVAGVLAHMLGCVLMLYLFRMDGAGYLSLLPKSITTAIGKSLSAELGGYPAITLAAIMLTGIFGAVTAPGLLKLFGIRDPLCQGLAIGTSAHALGTSRAVELGEVQGAASSLAIVVTGLLTVIAAPIFAVLVG